MRGLHLALLFALTIAPIAAAACGDPATSPADTAQGDTAELADTAPGDDTAEPNSDTGAADAADTAGPADTEPAGDATGVDTSTCGVACPEGELRCGGATAVETCVADANGCTTWSAAVACPGAEVCQAGHCVAACSAADDRCLNDAAMQHCTAGQLVETGCPFGCDALTAACRPCPQGAWRCKSVGSTPVLELCASGGVWSSAGPCIGCACAAGTPVTMQCLGKDNTATSCAACGDDGQICVP